MKRLIRSVVVGTALMTCIAAPAAAFETITVSFAEPDGAVTTGLYSGIVDVTISGVGFSFGPEWNDAFYIYSMGEPYQNSYYYQLSFGTQPLVPLDPGQNAANFLVGVVPAYNPDHVYSFQLNTGVTTPVQLHFGVSDGNFSDNGGSFELTVSQAAIPEPATWAMMIVGFGLVGAGMRRRMPVASLA